MMDQINAASFPAITGGGGDFGGSPLEKALISRHTSGRIGMPSMHLSLKKPKLGMHENQPKIKPLSRGFRNGFV